MIWPCTDELPDALVSRRVAAVVVRTVRPTPITPDGLSILSMLAGMGAAAALAAGEPAVAAAGILVSVMLDCADGQLARARGGGTPLGRLIDGTADYVVGAALHAALLVHVWPSLGPAAALALIGMAAVTLAYRSAAHDAYKSAYLRREAGPLPPYLGTLYRWFERGQRIAVGRVARPSPAMMRALGLAGPTCAFYVMAISIAIGLPELYLAYGAALANLYVIALRVGSKSHEDVE
jgi:phosphatidylglycerophosphate synthase